MAFPTARGALGWPEAHVDLRMPRHQSAQVGQADPVLRAIARKRARLEAAKRMVDVPRIRAVVDVLLGELTR